MNSLGRDGRTLILKGLASPFKNVRLWACRKVAVNHITVGVPGLIKLLNSQDPEVSVQAAVALEEISHLGSTPVYRAKKPEVTISHSREGQGAPYSSRQVKEPVARSVFPLTEDDSLLFGSGFRYYVRDLTPFKFIGASIGLFFMLYCLKELAYPPGHTHGGNRGSESIVSEKSDSGRVKPMVSSIIFEDIRSTGTIMKSPYSKTGSRQEVDAYLSRKKPEAPMRMKSQTSTSIAISGRPERADVWLAVALRYLEAGRPLECIKYCDRLIAQDRKTEEAKALKRLARERYGMID